MLKGFVSGEEKDIVRIPMKGRNLYNKDATNTNNGYISDGYLKSDGSKISTAEYHASEYIAVFSNQSYTLKYGTYLNAPSVCFYDSSKNFISGIAYGGRVTIPFTTPRNAAFLRLSFRAIDFYKIMLNLGSTALPYEPYGYQEGWEVRDNEDRILWGREDELQTATGTLPFKGYSLPLKVKSLLGNAVQNGTPAPDNIIIPEMCGKLVGSAWTIPLTNAGQTLPVYLGEVPTVRRVKKYEFTGTEALQTSGSGNARFFYMTITGARSWATIMSDRYVNANIQSTTEEIGVSMSGNSQYRVRPDTTSTVEEYKQYLTAQYTAGHPVTIWYVLNKPETTISNEPLCKISTYADELTTIQVHGLSAPLGGTYAVTVYAPPEIPTTTGQNTLTVDTDLAPSKLEVSIHAKKIHYGFKIDKSNDNSEDAVIYTNDAVTMTPAHMDFTNDRFDYGSWENAFFVRDCYPVALNLDGTEAYRLDPDDYTKKMDGTASDIFYELLAEEPSDWSTQWKQYYTKSGDEYVLNSQSTAPTFATDTYYKLTYTSSFTGNFMMAFPKVWFYRHEDSQYNYIEVSNHRLSDDWKCYAHINSNGQEVDFIYLPLFKGVIKDSKLRSLPGQIPQGNTTATTEANAATALGSRWQIWDHSSVECLNDLLTLMSKSIDSQGRFGQGRSTGYDSTDTVTYGKLQSGTLIKKGKFHGYSATTKEVKVFGIEGFWANRWDRLQGMLLVNNVWEIKMTPPYNFTGTDFITLSNAEVPSENGYLSKVQTSEYGSIPASIANGSSTKYFKDYFYKTATDTRVAIRGGGCGSGGGYVGFRYVYVARVASNSYWDIGASPVYK